MFSLSAINWFLFNVLTVVRMLMSHACCDQTEMDIEVFLKFKQLTVASSHRTHKLDIAERINIRAATNLQNI